MGNAIGGEEVDLLECVVLFLGGVGVELAEVPGAGAVGGGFDLDAEDAAAGFDADVVGGGAAPGIGDFEAVVHGLGHETEFGHSPSSLEVLKTLNSSTGGSAEGLASAKPQHQIKRRDPEAAPSCRIFYPIYPE